MLKKYHLLINILAFQLVWFACVFTTANNFPMLGIVVASCVVTLHLYIVEKRLLTLSLIVAIAGLSFWLVSFWKKDISVVDSFWSLFFIIACLYFAMQLSSLSLHSQLLIVMVSL